jgi:hypothetical protein
MPEKQIGAFARYYRWLLRVCFALLSAGVLFLLLTLVSMLGRLENMAPAELQLLLEIVKNRFFR